MPAPPTEPLSLEAPDGVVLEAEVRVPDGAAGAVVLAHPHPQYGGDMRAGLTSVLFDLLPARGVATLRFSFRGAGRSGGTFDEGAGERLDLVAAVAALAERVPGVALVVSGWSFGADVSLNVDDERIDGWCAVAPPLRYVDPATAPVATDDRPKVLAVPEHDQLNPPDAARPAVAGWRATDVEVVAGADHFLLGRSERVADLCVSLLERLAAAG